MKISITLEVLTGKFETDMNRAAKTTEKRMKEIQASAKKFGKELGLAFAAGAAAVAVAFKSAIDRADQLKETADKIGLTAEALSRLEFGAKQSGVELEQLQGAFVKLAKFQAEAVDQQSEAAFVFKSFGIAVKDSAGNMRDGESVFRDFVDVLSKLDVQTRNAIGVKVFGKSFAELVPLIKDGTKGLDDFAAASDRAGATVSNEMAAAADQFNDKLDALKLTLSGVTLQVASELLPTIEQLVDQLQATAQSGELVQRLEAIFDVVGKAAKILAGICQLVVDAIQSMVSQIGALVKVASAGFNLLTFQFKNAKKDFQDAKREFEAAVEAGAETRANLGLNLGLPGDPTGDGHVAPTGSGGRARGAAGHFSGFDSNQTAAQAAAKKILDLDNARREAAAKAAEAARAGSKAEAEARKQAAAAARDQKEAEDELHEKLKEIEEATKEFQTQLEDLQAKQDGPVAEANLEHKRQVDALTETFKKTELPASELTKALELMAAAHDKDVQAIKDRLDPAKQYLADLQTELDLINAKTKAERDAIEFKKQFPTATEAQAEAAARMQAQIDETRQVIENNNQLRESFEDAFVSILDGSKTASEAFQDFADAIIQQLLRIAAERAAIALFGEPNTAGSGILGSLLSALPGFATGTAFAPGGLAVVGESGPEIVNLPRGSQVIPTGKVGDIATKQFQININVDGATTKETAQQIASKVAGAVAFAGRAS